MTGLTIQILAMSTACPVTIDGRRRIAVQITWLGCVVAARAVGDRPTAVPGRLGFGNTGSVAMASITYRGVRQYLTISKVYLVIAMPSGCPARDIGMTIGAFDVDIFFKMPVVSASVRRVAVAGCAAIRIGLVDRFLHQIGVFAMWVNLGPFQRTSTPLPVATRDEHDDENNADKQDSVETFHSDRSKKLWIIDLWL